MQPVFILSGEASGARALADILNGNGLACLASAFDIANPAPFALGHFLRSRNVGAADLIAGPDEVLDEYLSFVAGLVRAEHFCLEVGHDRMHVFSGRSSSPGQPPRLAGLIRQRQYRVVYLSRRRTFLQAALQQLAESREGQPATAQFVFDIERSQQQMRQLDRLSRQMGMWFRGYDRFHGLAQEAVFEAGLVSDTGARLLETIFDRPIANRAPSLPLDEPDLRAVVANGGEVLAAFAESPQAREVREVLG
jgi:hypothetical protein